VIDVEITSHEFQFDGHSAHLVLATDVTEHKKLEVQFLRAQRMQLIGALAGGIAHDLNNALAPVSMGIELLREGISGDDLTSLLATMQGSAKRGVEMVRQILTFARGVSGEIAPLDLGQLVGEMDKFAQQTFPRSIAIHTRVASGLTRVVGNATQLHQVLLNLCVNARDAMPGGGTLRLEAGNVLLDNRTVTWQPKPVSGRHVLLTISDTGHGIPPEVMDRIFEPFFTTKQPGKGTGLGLSTVQGIVKSHGGFLEISSSAGVGTTFNVYLPAADSSLPDPADPVRNQNGSPESKLLTA
jgi:signal transduction histidine kinase